MVRVNEVLKDSTVFSDTNTLQTEFGLVGSAATTLSLVNTCQLKFAKAANRLDHYDAKADDNPVVAGAGTCYTQPSTLLACIGPVAQLGGSVGRVFSLSERGINERRSMLWINFTVTEQTLELFFFFFF